PRPHHRRRHGGSPPPPHVRDFSQPALRRAEGPHLAAHQARGAPMTVLRLGQAALYVAILAAWELLPRVGLIPRLFVPPLSEALGALVTDRRDYLGSLPTTFGEILVSYVIVCGGGILLGQVIGSSLAARRMLLPVLRSAYAVPLVVLYPVMMVWF